MPTYSSTLTFIGETRKSAYLLRREYFLTNSSLTTQGLLKWYPPLHACDRMNVFSRSLEGIRPVRLEKNFTRSHGSHMGTCSPEINNRTGTVNSSHRSSYQFDYGGTELLYIYGLCGKMSTIVKDKLHCSTSIEGVNQAYSRLLTTHGHITDCKLDSVMYAGVCVT